MSTAGSIRVGKAFVELFADDNMSATLKQAGGRLQAFGQAVARLGAGLAAAGVAGASAFGGAILKFAQTAAELNKLSVQTGASVGSLSKLRGAAKLTGVELEDLGGSIEEMNIRIGEAVRDGSGPLFETLQKLGVNMAELGAMTPVDQLKELSRILSRVPREQRQFIADELFGGDAFRIMPLLEKNIESLEQRAKELGLVLTDEEVLGGAKLWRAISTVTAQFSSLVDVIGSKVGPVLTPLIEQFQEVMAVVIEFARNNETLIQGLAAGAGILAVVGSAIATIGGTLAVAGLGLSGLTAAISSIGAVLAAVFSPVGLAVAGVTVGIIALGAAVAYGVRQFLFFTDAGRALTDYLTNGFTAMYNAVVPVLTGIGNAIKNGKWDLAASIAMAGMNAAWAAGIGNMKILFQEWKVWALNFLDNMATEMVNHIADTNANMVSSFADTIRSAGGGYFADMVDGVAGQIAGVGGSAVNENKRRSDERKADTEKLKQEIAQGNAAIKVALDALLAQAGNEGFKPLTLGPTKEQSRAADQISGSLSSSGTFSAGAALRLAGTGTFQKQTLQKQDEMIRILALLEQQRQFARLR